MKTNTGLKIYDNKANKTQLSLEMSTENFFENYNLLWYKKFQTNFIIYVLKGTYSVLQDTLFLK